MLVVDCESELGFTVWFESGDKHGERGVGVFDRAIESDSSCDLVTTIVRENWARQSSVGHLAALKVVNLEADTKVVVLTAHSLQVELDEHLYRDGTLLCFAMELQLRVVQDCVEVRASTSCSINLAPLRLNKDFLPVISKEAAQVEVGEVKVEVIEGHPEDSISFTDLLNATLILLHALVDLFLTSLVPLVRLVAPFTLPLSVISPWIP